MPCVSKLRVGLTVPKLAESVKQPTESVSIDDGFAPDCKAGV